MKSKLEIIKEILDVKEFQYSIHEQKEFKLNKRVYLATFYELVSKLDLPHNTIFYNKNPDDNDTLKAVDGKPYINKQLKNKQTLKNVIKVDILRFYSTILTYLFRKKDLITTVVNFDVIYTLLMDLKLNHREELNDNQYKTLKILINGAYSILTSPNSLIGVNDTNIFSKTISEVKIYFNHLNLNLIASHVDLFYFENTPSAIKILNEISSKLENQYDLNLEISNVEDISKDLQGSKVLKSKLDFLFN